MKKAQGLSTETLIIVALAVLVLLVIAIIFTQRVGKGEKQLNVVTNPLEYKAACLSKNQGNTAGYEECVKNCEADSTKAECKLNPPAKP